MNRVRLVLHLLRNGCILLREGSKHSIFRNLFTGAQTSVPRHPSLLEPTARAICRQLGVPMAAEEMSGKVKESVQIDIWGIV